MNLTREQVEHTIAFLEKQREAKARQCAALTCLQAHRVEVNLLLSRVPLPLHEDFPSDEITPLEAITEAVEHLIDSSLILSLQDLQGIDANLQMLKQQASPILVPHLGKR